MRRLTLITLTALILFATSAPTFAEIINIDNQQLEKLLADGIPLIDVRTPPEWAETGVVTGSHLLMFFDNKGHYDADAWLNRLKSIAKPSQPLILICRTGNRTTTIATYLDTKAGYSKVYNVKSGIRAWISEKRPVQKIASP